MANHLTNETSLYLQQHANNPVDWYPWNSEALEKAKRENKPILLSIGYAACHWCHVMAHESFEDEDIAALMNEWFINIKVDREERPDLDKIYQTAHQLLTGQAGGWPLTIFLSPHDQVPFYSGTYFPKLESFGRPSFKNILIEVAHFYHQRRDKVEKMTQTIVEALEKINHAPFQSVSLNENPLQTAREVLEKSFDFIHGGFGHAPKFPLPTHLEFLLEFAAKNNDSDALHMVHHALTRMSEGGIFDQLGGGFFRYCVDENWAIPHFEKMLYDNAQLIPLLIFVAQTKKDEKMQYCALQTLAWALREMHSPEGGFYASRNADSEGVEGKFYYWNRQEVRSVLTHLEFSAIEPYFGLNKPANFEGSWHLLIADRGDSALREYIEKAKEKLFEAREKRIHPTLDTKILTSWNALMIKALSIAAFHFNRSDFFEAAQNALDFIKNHLWKEGRLFAVYHAKGGAHFPAYLDDYAFLLEAILFSLQNHWREENFQWAITLADQLLKYFYDSENGGFFYTASDHESLIQRVKSFSDEALPAGNGVAARCLLLLGHWLGRTDYLSAAEKTLEAAWPMLCRRPSHYDSMLSALRRYVHPQTVIILRGDPVEIKAWQTIFASHYRPGCFCYALPQDATAPQVGVQASFCEGQVCRSVVSSRAAFEEELIRIC